MATRYSSFMSRLPTGTATPQVSQPVPLAAPGVVPAPGVPPPTSPLAYASGLPAQQSAPPMPGAPLPMSATSMPTSGAPMPIPAPNMMQTMSAPVTSPGDAARAAMAAALGNFSAGGPGAMDAMRASMANIPNGVPGSAPGPATPAVPAVPGTTPAVPAVPGTRPQFPGTPRGNSFSDPGARSAGLAGLGDWRADMRTWRDERRAARKADDNFTKEERTAFRDSRPARPARSDFAAEWARLTEEEKRARLAALTPGGTRAPTGG